ncbi:MAG: hypothetical protein K2X47_03080, partial [Bdellovibrionales bacterium]|nr:hypothetical protein [Bdellovibrionales bacterium]
RIFQLPGRSEILSQPGVRDLWYQRKIGELTDDSKSNFSWLLTVLTECTREKSSFENAALAADLASARTKIETSSLSDKRNSG